MSLFEPDLCPVRSSQYRLSSSVTFCSLVASTQAIEQWRRVELEKQVYIHHNVFANIFISLLITIGPNVNVVMKFIIVEMNILLHLF